MKFGSRVETVNVATGERKVLVESDDNITSVTFAGNSHVIFQKGDKSFNVPVGGGAVNEIRTATATSSTQSDGTFTYFAKGNTCTNQI